MNCMTPGPSCPNCQDTSDFGGSYGGAATAAPPRAKKSAGPAKKKGTPANKRAVAKKGATPKKGAVVKKGAKRRPLPLVPILVGVALLAGIGAGAYYWPTISAFATMGGEPVVEFNGPAKVTISAPMPNQTLSGLQTIKLQVASEEAVDLVEVTLDGSHWEKIRVPPWRSEWQTALVKNGPHVIGAKVSYRGTSKMATTKITIITKNVQ